MRPIVFSILLSFCAISVTSAQVNMQDSLALVALYDATNGDQWINNTNWLDGPVSTWYGVYVQGGRVNGISMYENGLNGYLPQELEQLTQLQSLVLNTSTLFGTIPDIFGQMSQLSQLGLDGCGLTGEIPSSLGNCSNLERIDLDKNNLTGTIPSSLAACSQLINLNVGENDLSGPFPEVIQSFPNLLELNLADNNFSGPLPDWIASLTELTWLLLNGNSFSGPAPFLGHKPNLAALNISDNTFTGNLENILGYYDKLRYCFVINTYITGTLAPEHFNPDEIIILNVSESQIHSLGFFADWIDHPNFLGMNVSDNYLDFDDLLPNSTMPDNRFFYSPQKPIGPDTVVTLLPGEEYAIYSPMQNEEILYQWYFNQMLIEGLENYDLILPPFYPELAGEIYFTATHAALPDLTMQSGITTLVEGTTSTELPEKSFIHVYPNPALDQIFVRLAPETLPCQLEIYSADGRLLQSKNIVHHHSGFSLQDYPSGLYILRAANTQSIRLTNIIKQ